jgi:Amt family ammonium transporter
MAAFAVAGALFCSLFVGAPRCHADNANPAAVVAPRPPTDHERLEDLEAAHNNAPRASDATPGVTSMISGPAPGHNGWMMTSTALVLFMTLPGLALFYGGLVREKNVLSVLAQCLGIAGLVTVLWWAVGYSFVFSHGTPLLGGFSHAFLRGVTSAPNKVYSHWVSENVFSMYQLMFAIITPALIFGAVAERMKFAAVMFFVGLWMLVVYFPMAHMVWGIDGFMAGSLNSGATIRALDFAGGTVVHMTSGWSSLILCIIIGKRTGFGKDHMPPHSLVLTMAGTGMLWVGWYGFNAGSALAADGIAASAFTATTLAAAIGSFTWGLTEYFVRGKASVLGYCSGAVSGLVVITPASGYVDSTGAVIIGVLAGLIPYFAVMKVKAWFGYDDALDTFGIHGVGGTLGALLTGILASAQVNPAIAQVSGPGVNAATLNGLAAKVGHGLWFEQVKAILLTILISVVLTAFVAYAVKFFIGLRPSTEVERQGLDINDHGEESYVR